MKFFFLLTLCMLCLLNAKAQEPCGTPLTEEMKSQLLDYHQHKEAFAASATDRVVQYVPIKFHIIGRSNGSGYYRLANLWTLLCELNTKYAPTGFYFYIYGSIQYIDNDSYFDHDFDSGDEMMNENNADGATNVYIVNDPAGYCGYFTWGPDAISVAKTCNAPGSTTLAHELGHYFSLPHPFDDVGSQKEYVNGTNCSFAGDLFCDTRADFLDYRWSCPYTGSETDPNGDPYDPDETLYMSYSYDNCQNNFSSEQMDAMNYNLVFERNDLLNHPAPDVAPITGTVQLVYPIDSVDDIHHDFVPLKWEPVAGADYYHLEVTRAPTFGAQPTEKDLIVYGTAITIGLEPDKKYHWRVLPVKNGYTCGTWSEPETFFTVLGTGVNELSQSTEGFKLYPSLLSEGKQLVVSLNTTTGGPSEIHLIAVDGRTHRSIPVKMIAGENNWYVSTGGLATGIYLVKVLAEGKVFQQKFVVTE